MHSKKFIDLLYGQIRYQAKKKEVAKYHATYIKKHRAKVYANNKKWYVRNRHQIAEQRRKALYGFDAGQYDALVAAQNGRCAICNTSSKLVVDHSHASGRVRGLLCDLCNRGLGLFRDNKTSLESAAKYLCQ